MGVPERIVSYSSNIQDAKTFWAAESQGICEALQNNRGNPNKWQISTTIPEGNTLDNINISGESVQYKILKLNVNWLKYLLYLL